MVLMLLCSFSTAFSQTEAGEVQINRCGTMEYMHDHHGHTHESLMQQSKNNKAYQEALERERLLQEEYARTGAQPPIYYVPVIFHIITSGSGATNLSASQVQAQLDQLNEDFKSIDEDGTWAQAADTEIEFCMSTVDENGNPLTEPGIMRWTNWGGGTQNDNFVDSTIKPNTIQDPSQFLNIWSINLGSGFYGYAQFPGNAANTDGVVSNYYTFGSLSQPGSASGIDAVYRFGRTTAHEVGHYYNLFHIWGDDGGGCNGSDAVADTPNQGNSTLSCPSGTQTSCNSSDMYQNFMDYTDDQCMNMFTEDQKTRMRAVFTSFANRPFSSGTIPTVCGPSTNPPVASFTGDPTSATICTGSNATFSFTDTSTGSPDTWSWSFSGAGVSPTSSNAQNPTVTVSSGGTLTVELTASNTNGSDVSTQTFTVTDNGTCTVFTPSDGASGTVCLDQCLNFFDQAVDNPTSWSWSFAPTGDLVLDQTSSNVQNPVVCVTGGTSGTIVATLTTNSGSATNTINVTVDANCAAGCTEVSNFLDTHNGAIYGVPAGTECADGYVAGTNACGDLAKADSYDLSDFGICTPSSCTGVTICMIIDAGSTGTFEAAIWDDNAGVPGNVIASAPLDAAVLDPLNNDPTNPQTCFFIDFSNAPVSITGAFYAGIRDLGNITGGVALFTNTIGESTTNTAFEQWADNSWNGYPSYWGIDVAHAIFPEILPGDPAVTVGLPTGPLCDDGTSYAFTGSSTLCTAGAGTAPTYAWTVSDGQVATTQNANFAFSSAGTYTVELCVTGLPCEVGCNTQTITVTSCGGGCNNFETYNSVVASGTYQAAINISSDGDVNAGTNVTFQAGTDIDLTEGFCVQGGAEFLATIAPCFNGSNVSALGSDEDNIPLIFSKNQENLTRSSHGVLSTRKPNISIDNHSVKVLNTNISAKRK